MCRVRSIEAAFKAIKAEDPGTSISVHAIRRAVLKGEIPSSRAGAKYLVDVDEVISFFAGRCNAASF